MTLSQNQPSLALPTGGSGDATLTPAGQTRYLILLGCGCCSGSQQEGELCLVPEAVEAVLRRCSGCTRVAGQRQYRQAWVKRHTRIYTSETSQRK